MCQGNFAINLLDLIDFFTNFHKKTIKYPNIFVFLTKDTDGLGEVTVLFAHIWKKQKEAYLKNVKKFWKKFKKSIDKSRMIWYTNNRQRRRAHDTTE